MSAACTHAAPGEVRPTGLLCVQAMFEGTPGSTRQRAIITAKAEWSAFAHLAPPMLAPGGGAEYVLTRALGETIKIEAAAPARWLTVKPTADGVVAQYVEYIDAHTTPAGLATRARGLLDIPDDPAWAEMWDPAAWLDLDVVRL